MQKITLNYLRRQRGKEIIIQLYWIEFIWKIGTAIDFYWKNITAFIVTKRNWIYIKKWQQDAMHYDNLLNCTDFKII